MSQVQCYRRGRFEDIFDLVVDIICVNINGFKNLMSYFSLGNQQFQRWSCPLILTKRLLKSHRSDAMSECSSSENVI